MTFLRSGRLGRASSRRAVACVWAVWLACTTGRLLGLGADAMQSMVIVEGDKGRGSAFIVAMDGKTYLVTNSHVVRGNKTLKFKTLSNKVLATGPLEIAEQEDLVRAEVTGVDRSLQPAAKVEQQLKIGDEIVVAGNSEGEGVVREIAGKIVGIGPDRIEVDAPFVPGNSGSPILLRSNGQVIGVATYLKIPRSLRGRSPDSSITTSLNEVRRFGYRLDTVDTWIKARPDDRLIKEGLKLAELEEMAAAVIAMVSAGSADLAKYGAEAYIGRDRTANSPHFGALAKAVEAYATGFRAAKSAEEKTLLFHDLFEHLKTAIASDVAGYKEENFTGYFAVLYKGEVERRKEVGEWLGFMAGLAATGSWVRETPYVVVTPRQPVDISKINLLLTYRYDSTAPPGRNHRLSYPLENKPSNLQGVYWIVESPGKSRRAVQMYSNAYTLLPKINGRFKVSVEYYGKGVKRVLSNVVEINVTDAEGLADEPPAPSVPRTAATLDVFLIGTHWGWSGNAKADLEFLKDGTVTNTAWSKKGLTTGWEVTGKDEVKLSILKGRTNHLEAKLLFAEDRSNFTGTDFEGKEIKRSQMLGPSGAGQTPSPKPAAKLSGDSTPSTGPSAALFDTPAQWTGNVSIEPGRYLPKYKIAIGGSESKKDKKHRPVNVTLSPGVEIAGGDVFVREGSWRADGGVFRSVQFALDLGPAFVVKNSFLEGCKMKKGGGRIHSLFSSVWTFENCVISGSFIEPWNTHHIGVQIQNCTFRNVAFAPIAYHQDASAEIKSDLMTIKSCRFIGCKVPESLLIATRDCLFEDCEFLPAEPGIPLAAPIEVKVYSTHPESPPPVGEKRKAELLEAKLCPTPVGASGVKEDTNP